MADREPYKWITVKGKHIPVYKNEYGDDVFGNGQDEEPIPNYEDSLDPDEFVKKNLKQLKELYNKAHKEGKDFDTDDEWRRFRTKQELKDIHEIPIEDALSKIRESIPSNVHSGWFRSANSEYKPRLTDSVLANPGTLNAGLNVAYYNYRYQFEWYSEYEQKWKPLEGKDQSKKLSFQQWLNTPQVLYRGDYGQKAIGADVFSAYTPDRRIAEKFLNTSEGGKISEIKIKPIETWGSYQTTAEQEFLVPKHKLKKGGN